MKKPSLTDALATKAPPSAPVAPPAPAAAPLPSPEKIADRRINTTLRLDPETLEELKIVAAKQRTRVNTLILEGVEHVLRAHRQT